MKATMAKEAKTTITAYKSAQENLKQQEVKLESLQARLSELNDRAVGLEDTVAEIGKKKKAMLSEIAIGNASESSLSSIKAEFEAAVKKHEDAVEMVDAVENEVAKMTAEHPPGRIKQCRDSLQRLERSAWAAVAADAASKCPDGLLKYIERVFVATRQVRGGGAVELPFGLGALDPPEISRERMEELRSELERQYFS